MSILKFVFVLFMSCLFGVSAAYAQTSISGAGVSISTGGSYKATGNITGLTISASHVVVDLNGFIVLGGSSVNCNTTAGTVGNSCGTSLSGVIALTITGSEVIVKNGTIMQGNNHAVSISGSTPRQDVTLVDLQISDFRGTGIVASTDGLVVRNVSIVKCGSGIFANGEVTLENVVASNNNSSGIVMGTGQLDRVTANWNNSDGISVISATMDHIVSNNNNGRGIVYSGVLRGGIAVGNSGDGIVANGNDAAVVDDSKSAANGGHGFTFQTAVSDQCYFGIATTGNSLSAISGGTALAGSVASCP